MRRPTGRRHPRRFGDGRSVGPRTSLYGFHHQERKSTLTIFFVDLHWGKVERDDMRVGEGLIRRLCFAAIVGSAFQPAFAHEPHSGVRIAAAPATTSSSAAPAGTERSDSPNDRGDTWGQATEKICLLAEEAATAHGLPLEFFARLIWRESRFNPGAVGPTTRSGQRAQGIAQFMPDTAKARGVLDPFDPAAALPKSAEFLRELRGQFGNLGLAAAAYNAGPKRVRDWLAGRSSLPGQTRSYVSAITGRSANEWAAAARRRDPALKEPAPDKRTSCNELITLLKAHQVLHADAPGHICGATQGGA
jgi:hypothetical protein